MSGKSTRADLIPDRGQAAVSEEFFRCRPFLDAEGVTHTLQIEASSGELFAPLIVREIPGADLLDAVSPYGYPGIVGADFAFKGAIAPKKAKSAIDPASVDFSAAGLVTAFVRHTLDEPSLAGATERNVVQIADPALPQKSRASDRNQINKNRRNGYEVSVLGGPKTTAEQRAGFLSAYEQTMRRAGAGERYFFGASYFDRILESDRTWLALALAPEGTEIAAASVAAVSDGFLHYYLSGTADSHLRDSPMKNVLAALIELSTDLSLPLNLGGGITQGDPLEEFKRGFSNRQAPWYTSELICDPATYARLSSGHKGSVFFPAYRA